VIEKIIITRQHLIEERKNKTDFDYSNRIDQLDAHAGRNFQYIVLCIVAKKNSGLMWIRIFTTVKENNLLKLS